MCIRDSFWTAPKYKEEMNRAVQYVVYRFNDKEKVAALTNVKFGSATYEQDEVYMRVAEAYFIKAEALASQATPDYPGAQQVLYDIVSTRDAAYTKSSATGQALLDEIRLQKRIEMWGEGLELDVYKRQSPDRTGC